jgi:hypothetical protein
MEEAVMIANVNIQARFVVAAVVAVALNALIVWGSVAAALVH